MKSVAFSQWKSATFPLQTPKFTHRSPLFSPPNFFLPPDNHQNRFPAFSVASSADSSASDLPPLVVVGSANADIYVEIDRLPRVGETIAANSGQSLAGGKGANQAACGGRLSYPTYFVGQTGDDANGRLIKDALEAVGGVRLDYVSSVGGAPTGHAVVMLQPDGENSIIIVGGANMFGWPSVLSDEEGLEVVKKAGVVLLQREIPDSVNIQVAEVSLLALSRACTRYRTPKPQLRVIPFRCFPAKRFLFAT